MSKAVRYLCVARHDPRWGNPTKDQVVSPVAGKVVAKVLRDQFVDAVRLHDFFLSRSKQQL